MPQPARHTSQVITVDGKVYVTLPDDQYIELTPDKARTLASYLYARAAEAEGKERPTLVLLRDDTVN